LTSVPISADHSTMPALERAAKNERSAIIISAGNMPHCAILM
jgi:hypothetical protein